MTRQKKYFKSEGYVFNWSVDNDCFGHEQITFCAVNRCRRW